MILFMIDGAIIQLLDPNKASEREQLLDYFFKCCGQPGILHFKQTRITPIKIGAFYYLNIHKIKNSIFYSMVKLLDYLIVFLYIICILYIL